jgi:hypothetical protein
LNQVEIHILGVFDKPLALLIDQVGVRLAEISISRIDPRFFQGLCVLQF